MTQDPRSPLAPLHQLARSYRVLVRYHDGFRRERTVSPEALLAVLRQLGAPLNSVADAAGAVVERRHQCWRQMLEPVTVVWDGTDSRICLRLPENAARGILRCDLTLESGKSRTWDCDLSTLPTRRLVEFDAARYVTKTLTLASLPWGYHRLRLEHAGKAAESLIVSAPRIGYTPAVDEGRRWGVFLPLYALHTERSWGAGDFTDLAALIDWTRQLGGAVVGTLPLLAAFLDQPCDPSPYTPVSRLFWNEFYLDVTRAPEFERSAAARSMLASSEPQAEIRALRSAPLVEYRRQMALKRPILEELARTLLAKPSGRREAFWRHVAEHPLLDSYARFRAAAEHLQKPWSEWPEPLRGGRLTERDYEPSARLYHLYVQWLAGEQLAEVAKKARQAGSGLYLDLPLGVHPAGFDVWNEPEPFARDVTGGAPPDRFFTKGQNWGFAPLAPEATRRRGYGHWIACLRHHLRLAGALRIDHVMGLHRLYWIPKGMEATEGAYVQYRPEEHYAILALESHRHRAVIVGEDLGTVPKHIRADMTDHGLQRMYVAQFQFGTSPQRAMRPQPAASLASINTHDLRPFAGFWEGADISDQVELGLLPDEAETHEKRREIKSALAQYLIEAGHLEDNQADVGAVLEGCLLALAAGPSRALLVNLEDLWQEQRPQNTPGTVDQRPNWRLRARYALEEFSRSPEVVGMLRAIDELRRQPARPTEAEETGPESDPPGGKVR